MGGPSWFDTSNQIWEISSQHDHEWAMNNVHKIRCLWLLSFVQDIGTFVCNNPDVYADGLVRYPAAMDALGVLHAGSRQSRPPSTPDDQTPCRENEFKRLACLLCRTRSQLLSLPRHNPTRTHSFRSTPCLTILGRLGRGLWMACTILSSTALCILAMGRARRTTF